MNIPVARHPRTPTRAGATELVPLVDLQAQHDEVADEVAAGFQRVIHSAGFIGGPDVVAFEQEFAAYQGVDHCVGVANGTDALELVLRSADIGRGYEVVIPANTFIATAEAVVRAGAVPVLVDCDPDFHLIDVAATASAIGTRTAALLPVHLYGQMAPTETLRDLAEAAGLVLIEDAAQAHGAKRGNCHAASFGLAAGTSFYPGKNLGAYGDAGAVLTNDPALASRVRRLGNHGSETRYEHLEVGVNSRLDALQAVVLRAKLARLEKWNELRRHAAARYHELLSDVERVSRPMVLADNDHVWHLYVVRVPAAKRDTVVKDLIAQGIGAAIHYPVPIHLQKAFAGLRYRPGDFPVAEAASAEIISLPIYPHITPGQQERVVDTLITALR